MTKTTVRNDFMPSKQYDLNLIAFCEYAKKVPVVLYCIAGKK